MIKESNKAKTVLSLKEIAYNSLKKNVNDGLIHKTAEDLVTNGRYLTFDNKKHLNFGSCSYLGVEKHPIIQEEAIKVIRDHGTLFSSSRTYVSLNLFNTLENLLRQIFRKEHIAVFSSITLGHMAVLPAIIDRNDAIIFDQQAHFSMQSLIPILQSNGAIVARVKHNNFEKLEAKIIEILENHNCEKIWYAIDGVYSMYGDVPDYDSLRRLQIKYKNLHYYIDDAHGMSWIGKNGCGYANSNIDLNDRIVLSASFSKSFGTGGCCYIFPNQKILDKVLFFGGNYTFTIPMYPPVLGAAIGSAKLHLSSEINPLQESIKEKIAWRNQMLIKYNLPHCTVDTPVCFVAVGVTEACTTLTEILYKNGLHTNVAAFPAVPNNFGGIRFTITNHNTFEDIEILIKTISLHLPQVLSQFNSSFDELNNRFKKLKFYSAA